LEKTLIFALHGFLGLPTDWHNWKNKYYLSNSLFIPINLWKHPVLNSSLNLDQWTNSFIEEIKLKINEGYKIELWGYSMGGRLALSTIIKAPHLFQRAVILSSNPGIENDSDRTNRLKNDLTWSSKFLNMDWTLLMNAWNEQSLFQVKTSEGMVIPPTKRIEEDFDRLRLSQALDHWSIARQSNFWPFMESIKTPIEWHVGALDAPYNLIAHRLKKLNSNFIVTIHDNIGHRLLGV